MNRLLGAAAIATSLMLAAHVGATDATMPAQPAARTQIVLLGTGTPRPDPKRSGPATAIVVNGTAYLVGLAVASLQTAFITHLHSDHTVGLPDLISDRRYLDEIARRFKGRVVIGQDLAVY